MCAHICGAPRMVNAKVLSKQFGDRARRRVYNTSYRLPYLYNY